MTATYPGEVDTVEMLLKKGNGATVEVFSAPCLINAERGLTRTATTQSRVLPRCDTPTAPGKTKRTVTALDSTISGAGTLDRAAAKTYYDAVGTVSNWRIEVGGATGDLVVVGAYILQSFAITGQGLGNTLTCTLTLEQADEPTSSAHS